MLGENNLDAILISEQPYLRTMKTLLLASRRKGLDTDALMRTYIQFNEIYNYKQSQLQIHGREISRDQASLEFVERGYAASFADSYQKHSPVPFFLIMNMKYTRQTRGFLGNYMTDVSVTPNSLTKDRIEYSFDVHSQKQIAA